MRIALINTPANKYVPSYIVPTGILQIAAWLEKHGHEVRVIDVAHRRQSTEEVINETGEFAPGLVGISALVTAYKYVIDLSVALRKAFPALPQVLGGQVTVNNLPNCFGHMSIDYAVTGYGEFPMEKLVRVISGSLPINFVPGLSYVRGDAVITNPGQEYFNKLDDMPLPAYHLVDMEYYATALGKNAALQRYLSRTGKTIKNNRFISVMGTLGCTDRCSFCIHEQEFVGLKVFSNDYLRDHLKFLNSTYGIDVFGLGEEMFITTLSRAQKFNAMMKEQFPDCYWYASTRANHVTPQLVDELKTGNCYRLVYGIESGSQKMLDLMKKRITREQNITAFKTVAESPLIPGGCLMVGNVGETFDTVKETLSFIREVRLPGYGAYYASAFPGGRTWDWAIERGIIRDSHEYLVRAQETNHPKHINSNLTPFPDWVLKAWNALIAWEQTAVDAKYEMEWGNFRYMNRKQRLKSLLAPWLGLRKLPVPMPMPVVRLALEAYFFYYEVSRRFFKTARDKQCEYAVDQDGSLLPESLIVGKPQRSKSDEELAALACQPSIIRPLVKFPKDSHQKVQAQSAGSTENP